MHKAVFLNVAKLDFDAKLDFSPLTRQTVFTKYDASSKEEILARVQDQQIVITKELPVGKELIAQFPSTIKLICEAGTGYNNIDIVAAREKNIAVCNVPGYSTAAVAQLAITFMLSLSSSLVKQQIMLNEKKFDNFTRHLQVPFFEVQHKTLGIIGFGAIAKQVATIAHSLGMNLLVCTRTPQPKEHPDVRFVGLEELLQQSDYVTLHCPLTPDTKYLLDKDRLKLMKPSAFLINVARGPIVKEADLIQALQKGELAGAGLDVQDPEPPELNNPLFGMHNVILTPHIGWKPFETRQRLVARIAQNIDAFLQGTPVCIVN